ncbi:MAG: hypothetical protein FWC78_09110 [Defluviitaleaceae bacterium]|nr:hypothetical protein [Defluviitaleaceae bacterium]
MQATKIRLKNRILQALYRPGTPKSYLPKHTIEKLDKIETIIEEKITPLLAEMFK